MDRVIGTLHAFSEQLHMPALSSAGHAQDVLQFLPLQMHGT